MTEMNSIWKAFESGEKLSDEILESLHDQLISAILVINNRSYLFDKTLVPRFEQELKYIEGILEERTNARLQQEEALRTLDVYNHATRKYGPEAWRGMYDVVQEGYKFFVEQKESLLLYSNGFRTEIEAEEEAQNLWNVWVENNKSLLEQARQIRQAATDAYIEKLKAEGRYVLFHNSVKGDSIQETYNIWTGSRVVFGVKDLLTLKEVCLCDGPHKELGIKVFMKDPHYKGNNSPEWEARVEQIRASARKSREQAQEICNRMNEQWKFDGYPMENS